MREHFLICKKKKRSNSGKGKTMQTVKRTVARREGRTTRQSTGVLGQCLYDTALVGMSFV